jgi:pSer/pThr/pTyr-binding forkhead associated (FHA) protein
MPFLEHGTSAIEVTPDELVVGSGAQASWRVLNADLAARHFRIRVEQDGTATVRPYSPSTIVVVNGSPISQQGAGLSGGDVVAAGSTRFVYLQTLNSPRPALDEGDPRSPFLIDERGRVAYPLVKRAITIGRDAAAAVPIRDPAVSRFHADLRAEAGQFVLYSMGSAGTHVNGRRVGAPRVLEDGDTIQIGSSTFRFTRGAVPDGVMVGKLGEQEADAVARRTTVAVGEIRDEVIDDEPRRRPGFLVVVVAAAMLLALAAWFVFSGGS